MLCVTAPSITGVRWQRKDLPVMVDMASPSSRPSERKRALARATMASIAGCSEGSSIAMSRCTS